MLFFPDNTVLVNFAILRRLDLLETLLMGKGRWCASVSFECSKSAKLPELEILGGVRSFLGDPILPSPAEILSAKLLRESVAGPGDRTTDHLGEAETVAILTTREEFSGAVFVSDDKDAKRLAGRHSIKVADTWSLLGLALRSAHINEVTHSAFLHTLRAKGRQRATAALYSA